MNQIYVIEPYKVAPGWWVFSDPLRGLLAEPFVAGIPEMIEEFIRDIPGANSEFLLAFSDQKFRSATPVEVLERVGKEHGGAWYRARVNGKRMYGWLCPALLRYFPEPPERIWVSAGAKT